MIGHGRTLFVANRGEIALRIIRTARDLGFRTAVMFVPEEIDALYVRAAHTAVEARPTSVGNPFLDIPTVLGIARRAGADLLHPGYGFLSENPEFAAAVRDSGITWVGPSPEAIARLGDKVRAREVARSVDAPLAPGIDHPIEDVDEILRFGTEVGFPLAIKASHGGGGRGMRIAQTADEVEQRFLEASREAELAFGNGDCFVEKFLSRPRHLETQCLADAHGGVVVVSTRDCSLQRRHQKLVEEAPAPGLSTEQIRVLTDASKRILRHVGYIGAATCEFLLSEDGTLSFLEVNTRLQVEHTVTEEVTGVDLVEQQLRIADGLPLALEDNATTGHAVEFRINCEDPANGFFPSVGALTAFRAPAGPWVRVDSGVETGSRVSEAFDSMVAKLIVRGEDRAGALGRAARALEEFDVSGVATVIPLYRRILDDPTFLRHGTDHDDHVYTQWLENDYLPAHPVESAEAPQGSAVPEPPQASEDGFTTFTAVVDGHRRTVTLPTEVLSAGGSAAAPAGDTMPLAPRILGVNASRSTEGAAGGGHEGTALTPPARATVVKLFVEVGHAVEKGDALAIIEAMKMEHTLTAPTTGTVGVVHCSVGASVDKGEPLLHIV